MPHPRLLAGCTLLQLAATLVAADPVALAELPEPARPEAAAAWRALPVAQRSAVVVDGDLAEWSESGAIDLPFDPGQQRVREWGGLADCSARLRLGWSEEALLIAVQVRDDRHEPLSGEHLWQGDSIQFATGLDGLGPEFGVAAGAEGVRTYRWNHGPSEGGQITAAAKRGDGVTTYEVAVPWTAVAGGKRPAGRLLGFSLVVNDNDGSGRKGYIELTAGIGETKDHRRYALLAFAGADRPSLAFGAPGRVAVDQGGSIRLDGWAYLPEAAAPRPAAWRITGPAGRPVAEARSTTSLPAGQLRPVRLDWRPALGAEPLTCTVALEVAGARIERRIEVIGADAMAAAAARALAARDALAAAQAALPRPDPYARAALAVAARAIALAPRKVAVDDAMTAFEDHRFAAALCDRLRGEVGEIAAGKRAERAVPAPALDRLRRADGNFWAGDQPVMLVGAMGYSELKQDLDQVRDLGFNTVGTDFASGASLAMLTGPDQADLKRLEELKQAIALCAGKGFTWSYTPSLHYFPLWALKAHADVTGGEQMDLLPDWSGRDRTRKAKDYGSFFPFSIFSPTVHTLVGRLFDVVLPELERAPGSGICWLMNEPRYHKDRDPVARERFQAFLRQRHASLEELNARWGTSHRDFAAIELQAGGSDPGRHDYLDWHQAEVGGWFSWLGAEARKRAPEVPLSSKPMAWTLFAPETGIDFEREALEWEVPGCDSGREPHDRWTAFNGVEAGTLLDFQKSVAPGKPLADHEYHWVHAPGLSAEYSRATFLHSYLHGLRWSQFWVWGNGDLRPGSVAGGSGMQYTAVSQPAVLWGAAQAALDLRRLAPVMAAFPQPAQVAIAFSRPTLFRDGTAHRDRIHAAYRAATALDAPVGFATGRMMREGQLARYRLLILPGDRLAEPAERDAIQAFLDQGGTVVQIGPCLAQDPYRRPLAPLTAGKGRLVQLDPAEPPALAARLDDLLTAAGIERPVRVRARDGRPAWPLECRTAIVDGRRVVALIGSDKAARRVVLEGAQPVAGWQDLLSGERQAAGEFTLAPNEVRFLRLDP